MSADSQEVQLIEKKISYPRGMAKNITNHIIGVYLPVSWNKHRRSNRP